MSTTSPLGRIAATVALAGFAALGSVAITPAASAAPVASVASVAPPTVQDGPASVVDRSGENGPDAFILLEHGRRPVFFCDVEKPRKLKNNCELVVVGGDRF